MATLLVAVLPPAAVGVWNTGYQALAAAARLGATPLPGWRGDLLRALGVPADPEHAVACLAFGLACALPMLAVAAAAGLAWERLFARRREGRFDEALPVVVVLFVLLLPPTLPLWQVALGASFAVVVGLEIFGGTGRNVVNPALVGLAFLYFAYPAGFSGDAVWVPVDGPGGRSVLELAAQGGLAAVREAGLSWLDTLVGRQPGALGETSALACALGAALLLHARLVSWRILAGGVLGMAVAAATAGAFADAGRPLHDLPILWHLTSGGFAFGLVFLATDPVTSAATAAGRWAYGAVIGLLVVLVRVFNPAHAEGVLMAILLANVLAPLFDHLAVRVRLARVARRKPVGVARRSRPRG